MIKSSNFKLVVERGRQIDNQQANKRHKSRIMRGLEICLNCAEKNCKGSCERVK